MNRQFIQLIKSLITPLEQNLKNVVSGIEIQNLIKKCFFSNKYKKERATVAISPMRRSISLKDTI